MLNPMLFTLGGDFAFPERCAFLQIVDDIAAGIKRVLAVRRPGSHQHDGIGRHHLTHAMHHQGIHHIPFIHGLLTNLLDVSLRHARVVIQTHGAYIFAVVKITHSTDEQNDPAVLSCRQRRLLVIADLLVGVHGILGNQYFHLQPPVTGGKKATSSPLFSS